MCWFCYLTWLSYILYFIMGIRKYVTCQGYSSSPQPTTGWLIQYWMNRYNVVFKAWQLIQFKNMNLHVVHFFLLSQMQWTFTINQTGYGRGVVYSIQLASFSRLDHKFALTKIASRPTALTKLASRQTVHLDYKFYKKVNDIENPGGGGYVEVVFTITAGWSSHWRILSSYFWGGTMIPSVI